MKRDFVLASDADRDRFFARVAEMSLDKPLRVTVAEYRKNRSTAQNNLNWLWCDFIRRWMWDTGRGYCESGETEPSRPFTAEEIHEWHKSLFLPTETYTINGREVARRSSHDKNMTSFASFLNEIEMYWATRGLLLPRPDDLYLEAIEREVEDKSV